MGAETSVVRQLPDNQAILKVNTEFFFFNSIDFCFQTSTYFEIHLRLVYIEILLLKSGRREEGREEWREGGMKGWRD